MDDLVRLVQVLAPLVTIGVAILGIRAWYWQLAAKRKFEIAEQSITVFRRANDAISRIRDQSSWSAESDEVKIPDNAPEERKKLLKQYGIYFKRMEATSKAFEDVRLAQILASLHLSQRAGECFEALFRVRHLTWVAVHMLIEDYNPWLPPEQRREQDERRLAYHRDLYEVRANGKPQKEDRLSQVLDEALATLEQECRLHLSPPTFWQFIFGRVPGDTSPEWSDTARKVLMLPTS